MTRAFLYGTLRDEALRRIVLGEEVAAAPALLPGHSVCFGRDGDWPTLVREADSDAPGVLTAPLPDPVAARLDWYEAAFGARPETVAVGGTSARLYRGEERATTEDWSLAAWQARWVELTRAAAEEAMGYYPARDPVWLAARWPQIRQRAASAVNAVRGPAPMDARRGLAAADVEVVDRRRPYTDYFSLVEQDLRFRCFDGGMSPTVTRAALVAGDAATVLPYDPAADAVLLIEQFRFGPWVRGDLRPWTLEPIAGRLDPGESPEETVRREALEEAGVTIGWLEKVAAYYPTTGAMSEYVHSFVGIADLSGQSGTVAGADAEDEDILSHVLPFDRLMELVASGEAENGPLLISAFWLAANRARLRG